MGLEEQAGRVVKGRRLCSEKLSRGRLVTNLSLFHDDPEPIGVSLRVISLKEDEA
jgi:hypothetical protein